MQVRKMVYGGEREREKNGGLKKKKKKSFAAQVFFTTYLVTVHTSQILGCFWLVYIASY